MDVSLANILNFQSHTKSTPMNRLSVYSSNSSTVALQIQAASAWKGNFLHRSIFLEGEAENKVCPVNDDTSNLLCPIGIEDLEI